MQVISAGTFHKDISKIRDKKLLLTLKAAIEKIEAANTLSDIPNLKKMEGSSHYFRIRIGSYRLGLYYGNNTIFIVRFLHRKEIYRYFP